MQSSDRDLFLEYRSNPSILLRNRLVARNLKLVYQVLHKFWEGQSVDGWEDLRQEGIVALIAAVEKFDCLQGVSFASYSVLFIRGRMSHCVRDKMFAVRGSRSIDNLLARQSIDAVQAARLKYQLRNIWHLEMKIPSSVEDPMTLEETLAAPNNFDDPEIQSLYMEIDRLPNELRQIVWLRLEDVSRKDIARRLGISPMAVTRRLDRACKWLKQELTI